MKSIVLPIIALALGAVSVPAGARADQASASVLANTCFSCHGHKGKSLGAMPSIQGKPAKYIETMLTAFRDDKRQGTVMNRIAKGFSPAEIEALSQYFATLK